jgi:hypothetical protein
MTNHLEVWRRLQVRRRLHVATSAGMVLSISGLSGLSFAAEPLAPARPGELHEILASATVLSEAAMSKENAARFQPAQIIGQGAGHSRVTLWDELKAPPLLPLGANGTSTLSAGGEK